MQERSLPRALFFKTIFWKERHLSKYILSWRVSSAFLYLIDCKKRFWHFKSRSWGTELISDVYEWCMSNATHRNDFINLICWPNGYPLTRLHITSFTDSLTLTITPYLCIIIFVMLMSVKWTTGFLELYIITSARSNASCKSSKKKISFNLYWIHFMSRGQATQRNLWVSCSLEKFGFI